MSTVSYKGFSINASPHQHPDSMEWNINICIIRDKGFQVAERNFHAANTYKTKEEAILHCIEFGRRIIDGEIDKFQEGLPGFL